MNKLFNSYISMINENLFNIYNDGPVSLTEPISYVLNNPGKRLRPLLAMLVADSLNNNNDDALKVALSIEMLHNFTLIHDDIMDGDNFRHGKVTVHCKWDESTAILAGDALLSLSLMKINEVKNNHKNVLVAFTKGLLSVCEGQALDIEYEQKDKIDKDQYNHMIELKTGHLIGLSAELGALVSGADSVQVDKLKKFGLLIGKAFQIQDDLLEVVSDKDKMGKSLSTDLLLQKKTYVLIESLNIDENKMNSIIDLAKVDIVVAKVEYENFIKSTGIYNTISNEVSKLMNESYKILNSIDIDTSNLNNFIEIVSARKV